VKIPCPQCGGEVRLQDTAGFVGCPYCGSSLVLDLTGVRPHLALRERLAAGQVLPLLRRWCDAHGFPAPVVLVPPRLTYYPFWRYVVAGRPRLVPAWPTVEGRWTEVPAPEAEQEVFDPAALGNAPVVESSVPEAAARARAFGGDAPAAGDLVHVPFYDLTLRAGTEAVRVAVDACAGHVYPDRFPAGVGRQESGEASRARLAVGWLLMFLAALLIPPAFLAALVVGALGWTLYWLVVGDVGRV